MSLIKKLDEYFNSIKESLDNPKKIDWIESDNSHIGYFELNDVKYRIECLNQISNNYSYSFSYFIDNKWSYQLSNLGRGGFSVLSTIIGGVEYIFSKCCPNSIIFSAVDDSDTRKRLYEDYCNKICKKYKYKLSNRGSSDRVLFILFKNNLSTEDMEDVFSSVKKIVEQGK